VVRRPADKQFSRPEAPESDREKAKRFDRECQENWDSFADLDGERLSCEFSPNALTKVKLGVEIKNSGGQTLASAAHPRFGSDRGAAIGRLGSLMVGQKSYGFRQTSPAYNRPGRNRVWASFNNDAFEKTGRYEITTKRRVRHPLGGWEVLDDTTGRTMCRVSGFACKMRMTTRIELPGGRWLRFAVRGTSSFNDVVTAVNQDGQPVVRYRCASRPRNRNNTDIVVSPAWPLTEEHLVAMAISSRYASTWWSD
jgi:hypothetical protein